MSAPALPRHARAEIRSFAKWLRSEGWVYESVDAKGHTIWAHPAARAPFKLPETPKHFDVQRARRDVMRLMGRKPPGHRRKKPPPVVKPRPRREQPGELRRVSHQPPLISADAAREIEAADARRREIERLMQPSIR